ncbi:hypothetical protein L228DRAFT_65089 [Xylona heveae TC161]|uniref:Uncharacterized protein n=1 Tax=Xylona heveae (strain CBS 132557 / TC161) TaxID=1328760 RepID=A0A165IQQ8_XYLHT|nr:hypothetical protein L228DRAFT_65089 [Xylona heveae TC161]KZF25245.1 hypothetical protein L228DRAFT_65089 [Xylona heveae TC161]
MRARLGWASGSRGTWIGLLNRLLPVKLGNCLKDPARPSCGLVWGPRPIPGGDVLVTSNAEFHEHSGLSLMFAIFAGRTFLQFMSTESEDFVGRHFKNLLARNICMRWVADVFPRTGVSGVSNGRGDCIRVLISTAFRLLLDYLSGLMFARSFCAQACGSCTSSSMDRWPRVCSWSSATQSVFPHFLLSLFNFPLLPFTSCWIR